jgi:hypothetical protein
LLPALPAALRDRHATLDLFFTLAGLIQEVGGHVTYGATDSGDGDAELAVWDAATRTLTLDADADDAEHTWALTEFCRHLTDGISHYVEPPRHLYAVS